MTDQEREKKQARLDALEDEARDELLSHIGCNELAEHLPDSERAEYLRLHQELFGHSGAPAGW